MQTNLEAIKLMNSEGFEEDSKSNTMALAPKAKTSVAVAQTDDINQKIINKIVSLSKAISDEFELDQKAVMEDIIKDLRIAGGEEILDVIKGDSPIEQMSKEMGMAAREIGMDSNIALNTLLSINEKDYVEAFRRFISGGRGQLPHFAGRQLGQRRMQRMGALPNMPESIMESVAHRVLLDEGLKEIQAQYYADIKEDVFNKLVALDPTFNAEQDKLGTYGKWILNAFKQKRLKERDFERVNEILFDFNDRKRFITPPDMRDINRYKTLDEVRAALDNIQLTANQIAKQARKAKQHADLGEEAEFIGENDKWEIWSPKTYAASCKLGSGTTWCTASTSYQGYYDSYTRSGKLYVFYPKSGDTTQKFQAHVKNGVEVTAFMDANDRPSIEFSTFIYQQNLLTALKESELKNVDAIMDVENMERLGKGEPYMYAGGKVKSSFAPIIKVVRFVEDYNKEEIPGFAFKGCVEMKEIYVPIIVKSIGVRAFEGCEKVTIYTPKHPMKCYPSDLEFLKDRIKYVDKI
jgi:hypothetical protein